MSDILPEIRINFADLLYFNESQTLAGKEKLDSYEQYEKWTEAYRKEWRKYETKIITALEEVLNAQFYKPVIDVSCAPYFIPKSDPLIMNFRNEPDQFVDVLMHELCHVLLTDNNVIQIHKHTNKKNVNLAKVWEELFGKEHDFSALVHIPVHALSKYIYLDILKEPSRLKRDIDSVKTYVGSEVYTAAWDYVDKQGYKEIIGKLKHSYKALREQQ